jgi:hypothetical protein
MEQWSYGDYQHAVSGAVNQGLAELGFTVDQAVGYARQDLELRLQTCPQEMPLAAVALASVVIARSNLSAYPSDDGFVEELRAALLPAALEPALQRLKQSDRDMFLRDLSAVRAGFLA